MSEAREKFQPSPTEPIVHGAGGAPEAKPDDELAAVTRERDALKAALEQIKTQSPATLFCYPPKDYAAEKARETLEKLASGELRKVGA